MSESTHALILFVVSMAIGLGVYIGTCRYYDAREQGAKMFCVEQRAKHKFCEKYFNGRDHMSDGRPWPFNK